jgi:CRISPR-associated protein Cas2
MWVVVCYDVNTETKLGRRRLRRVAQVCKNFGQYEDLRRKLLKEINQHLDSLRIYRITEPRDHFVETFGTMQMIFFDEEPLVV